MDFAKNVLQKYGWKEGLGLGKNMDGIVAPIRARRKQGNSGIGAPSANDATNNWWARVYDEAATNIEVQADGDKSTGREVTLKQLDPNAVEVTTNSYSMHKLTQRTRNQNGGQESKYGNVFLRASTLLGDTGREEDVPNHVRTEDIEFAGVKTLTDEELFAACGGRTAHKGARHGLGLKGKLARIDEQNKKLLQQLESNSFEAVIKSNDWQVQTSKNGRKKSKKQKRNEQRWIEHHGPAESEDAEVKDMIHHADYVVSKNKKKKQAQQKSDQELASGMFGMFAELPEEEVVEEQEEAEVAVPVKAKKSKSKSKKALCLDDELDLLSEKIRKLDHSSITIKKKDKKKKNKHQQKKGNGAEDDDDTVLLDPAAKYRKDYRPELKQNNRLLKAYVPDEVPEGKLAKKPAPLLRSDSSDQEEEDVVQRVNEEQKRYWSKMRANVPKINIIEPTEDDCLALGQSLRERHRNEVKRVGNRTASGKRKKTKKSQRQLAQLADKLSKNL